MPTYEYVCRACGRQLEVVQSFSDDALTICPHCSGELRKVFGNVGIVFKGSGFYKNDSRQATSTTKPTATSDTSSEHGHDHAGHDHASEHSSTPSTSPTESSTPSASPTTSPATPASTPA